MKQPGKFTFHFEIQEFPEDQPSTSRQGDSIQQDEMEEEEEEWETEDRRPFTYWSPIVREKIKRQKKLESMQTIFHSRQKTEAET